LRYCGRTFTAAEMDAIRAIIAKRDRYPTWAAISRAVCEVLGWRKVDGQPKVVSCRVALLRMQQDGWMTLPAPRRGVPRCGPTAFTSASDPQPELSVPRHALGSLELRVVKGQAQARPPNHAERGRAGRHFHQRETSRPCPPVSPAAGPIHLLRP